MPNLMRQSPTSFIWRRCLRDEAEVRDHNVTRASQPDKSMTSAEIIDRLERNAATISSVVAEIGEEEARWKPAPDSWSVHDVLNHLADEERSDFRQRLDLTLHHPEQNWPGINPEASVRDRRYTERTTAGALEDFLQERRRSVEWLRSLDRIDWSSEHHNPRFGSMSAGTLFVSWLAHDYHHIRQLTLLRLKFLQQAVQPYSTDYAV